jgi:RNA polymerase sigma factor (sigma-70 family)
MDDPVLTTWFSLSWCRHCLGVCNSPEKSVRNEPAAGSRWVDVPRAGLGDEAMETRMAVDVHDVRTLSDVNALSKLSDAQLLDRFAARREEAAFEAIIQRHGPMVWGVCCRVLRDHHDAEDAFQATFLVLARKGSSVSMKEKLGNWLYGVAYQTAMKARTTRAKRRQRESHMPDVPERVATPDEQRESLTEILDRELSRLPEKYRIPIVLCELEGRTHKEAAEQLGWPIGTLSGRLSRARSMLAKRLALRGVAFSGGSLALFLTQDVAAASMPTAVVASTVKAAGAFAAGHAAAGAISVQVAALAEGVLKTMFMMKLTGAMVVTVVIAGIGGGLLAYGATSGAQNKNPMADATAPRNDGIQTKNEGQTTNDATKTERERLQGTWQLESQQGNGQTLSGDDFANVDLAQRRVLIDGDKWIYTNPDGKTVTTTFKIDVSKTPKFFDAKALNGVDQLGIYKLEGDTLTICQCGDEKQDRPTDFTTRAGSPMILSVYKRVAKPAK